MRILFVCRFLPHSRVRDSGRLDTYHYIASLAQSHQVSLIAFVPARDAIGLEEMQDLCAEVVVVPYADHVWARLVRAWWRFVKPKVYGRNFSWRYVYALRRLLQRQVFDVAVVDGMMAEYGRYIQPVPTVLDEVDLFFVVAHQYFRDEKRPLSRLWAGFDWLRTTWRETSHLQNYDGVFVRSQKDAQLVQEFAPQQRVAILPPWFEGLEQLTDIPIERHMQPPVLLFVGAMYIPANVTAVTYFAKQVFPLLQARIPDIQFMIVGSQPTPTVQALASNPGITVTGEVPDLKPYYAQATICVVPLFTGGGIIVKTLNGLASGRPVVATTIGNSGTGAQNGRDLYIVPPDPQVMAEAVLRLLEDESEWKRLAQNGRKFIEIHHDWKQTVTHLEQFLDTTHSST